MNDDEKSKQSAWHAFQEIGKKETQDALRKCAIIQELITEYSDIIPTEIALSHLEFNSIEEMKDWEGKWLPRKELNVSFEVLDDKIQVLKDVADEEELEQYEFMRG